VARQGQRLNFFLASVRMINSLNDRWPGIGDMIIQKSEGKKYVGIVCRIVADGYGHKKIFINWDKNPPDYYDEYGYSAQNIHNLRRTFDLIKTRED
jgi:hypothetical protein